MRSLASRRPRRGCSLTTLVALVLTTVAASAQSSTPAPPSAATVATAPTAATQARPLTRADLESWLDGVVPVALKKGNIAGAVVSIVYKGDVVFEKGYGYADVAQRTPMDARQTVVRVASVSKTFTATAVMQLVQDGKLDLDRDVNDYLDFKIPAGFNKPITLRNLLTHTAGFEETPYKRYQPPLSLREHLLMIPDRIYPPGETPAYSNYGLELAGYIVQRASGESIASYIEKHILEPLGMQHSVFRLRLPATLEASVAKTYSVASSPEPISWTTVEEMSPVEAPAVALATTADDMTHFMLAHLQDGRFGDVQLLSPETIARMHAPSFVPVAGLQPIALGLFYSNYKGHRVFGHEGDGEGAHAELKFMPDERLAFFLAVNSDGAENGFTPAAFSMRAHLFESLVDRYFPSTNTPQEPTAATAKDHAKLIAGEYAWARQQRGDFQEAIGLIGRFALGATVRVNDDGTIVTPPYLTFEKDGRTQTWREIAPFVWREVGGEAHLVARVRDGKVDGLWSDQVATFWIALRVPALYSAALTIPLLLASTVVLLLNTLAWPIAAFLHRRRGAELQLTGHSATATRLTRFAALIGVLYMLGWFVALAADLASKVGGESWVRVIQLLGLLTMLGAVVAIWCAWTTGRATRVVRVTLWRVVIAAALLYIVWFSFAFHLMSARIN